jgi:hypothetical protein
MSLRNQLRLAITAVNRVVMAITPPPEELFDFLITQSGDAITTQSDIKIQVDRP